MYKSFILTSDSRKLYEEALKLGYVQRTVIKCIMIGAAGVGKTSFKHLLLNKQPPPKDQKKSTGVMEKPVRAISHRQCAVGSEGGSSWYEIKNDEEYCKLIAYAIKSGVKKTNQITGQDTMEEKTSRKRRHSLQKPNRTISTDKRPVEQPIKQVDSSEGQFPSKRSPPKKTTIGEKLIKMIHKAQGMCTGIVAWLKFLISAMT